MHKIKVDAQKIANFFVRFSNEHGDNLTNLKLQKLLYFAQAWYLVFYKHPLFDNEIQAWVHGPVIPEIYSRFKKYGWSPIIEEISKPDLSENIKKHLIKVFNYYGRYSAYELESITYGAEPWKNARDNLPPDASSENIISHQDMQDYYNRLYQEFKLFIK